MPMLFLFFQNKGGGFSGRKEIYGKAPIYQILALTKIKYIQDETIKQLVDTTDISLVPTINPDGFKRAKAGQCSGKQMILFIKKIFNCTTFASNCK